jgi:hypothetical protein
VQEELQEEEVVDQVVQFQKELMQVLDQIQYFQQ